VDLHTRRLRLALLVAQERNVTRAAARVHLSQQALSQQIAALEKDLGFQVFVRSSRGVDVTPAGRTMLAAAHGVLETLDDAYRTARRAVDPARLSVGFLVGGLAELTPVVLDALADTDPATELELVEHPLSDPAAGLRTGQSDVALLRPPFGRDGS
jgi:DNA-binding transcriptional LysR family regulator